MPGAVYRLFERLPEIRPYSNWHTNIYMIHRYAFSCWCDMCKMTSGCVSSGSVIFIVSSWKASWLSSSISCSLLYITICWIMADLEEKLKKRLTDTIQTRTAEQVCHCDVGCHRASEILSFCLYWFCSSWLVFSLFIVDFLQAQIVQLQADLKRLLAKMPRRVRESISELDRKIMYVHCSIHVLLVQCSNQRLLIYACNFS